MTDDNIARRALLEKGSDAAFLREMQGNLTEAVTVVAANAAKEGAARGRVMLNTAPLRWDYARLLPLCDVVVAIRGEARAITGCDGAAAAVALRAGGGAGSGVGGGGRARLGTGCGGAVGDAGGVLQLVPLP